MKSIETPIAAKIEESCFTSTFDGTQQTFLVGDLRAPGGAGSSTPLVVVYLHGAESHQEQGMTAEIYGDFFGKLAAELRSHHAVYICPEYRGRHSWMGAAAESDVLEVIRMAKLHYHPDTIILMGGSMGGTSALIFGMLHADQIDGIIAMCPATDIGEVYDHHPEWRQYLVENYGGTPDTAPSEYKKRSSRYGAEILSQIPIAITHGTGDDVLPVCHSRILVNKLKEQEATVSYIEIEQGDHDSPLGIAPKILLDFALQRDKA